MFEISTRLRYGLRALIYIAAKGETEAVNLSEISEQESISRKYLENIFKLLKKDKVIKSARGRQGGYTLAKPANQITLHHIAIALEGNVALLDCLNYEQMCDKKTECGVREFWNDYQEYIKKYLDNITLLEMIEKYSKNKKSCP